MATGGLNLTADGDLFTDSDAQHYKCPLPCRARYSSDGPTHLNYELLAKSQRGAIPSPGARKLPKSSVLTPKHPKYQSHKSRLESYVGWPFRYVHQSPEDLASSGFFYIGSADRVTCFQCGVTLRDWNGDHDSDEEHRRYSPDCGFINACSLEELGVSPKRQRDSQEQCFVIESKSEPLSESNNLVNDVYRTNFDVPFNQTTNNCELVEEVAPGAVAPSSYSKEQGTDVTSLTSITPADSGTSEMASSPKPESSILGTHESQNFFEGEDEINCCPEASNGDDVLNELAVSNGGSSTSKGSASTVQTTADSNELQTSIYISVPYAQPGKLRENVNGSKTHNSLHAENKRLKNRSTCRLCSSKSVSILFLPCGHLISCETCAQKVSSCLLCGKSILATAKTFFG